VSIRERPKKDPNATPISATGLLYEQKHRQRPNAWCERGDANPHGFTCQILSPIPAFFKCSGISYHLRVLSSVYAGLVNIHPVRSVPSCDDLFCPVGQHLGSMKFTESCASIAVRFITRSEPLQEHARNRSGALVSIMPDPDIHSLCASDSIHSNWQKMNHPHVFMRQAFLPCDSADPENMLFAAPLREQANVEQGALEPPCSFGVSQRNAQAAAMRPPPDGKQGAVGPRYCGVGHHSQHQIDSKRSRDAE